MRRSGTNSPASSSTTACCVSAKPESRGAFKDSYNIPLVHVDAADKFLGCPRRRHRPGSQAQDHRPPLHRGVRGRSQGGSAARSSWPRARSIPTSSRASPSPAGPRDHQVTSQCGRAARGHEYEACRAASRVCSRTRSAARPRTRVCPKPLSAGIPSLVRASRSAFPAR